MENEVKGTKYDDGNISYNPARKIDIKKATTIFLCLSYFPKLPYHQ